MRGVIHLKRVPAALLRSGRLWLAALALSLGAPACLPSAAAEINLYTTREAALVKPLIEAYAARTGTKVNTVVVASGLAERLQAEGARSPADVVLTDDFGALADLVDRGLTQPVTSALLEAAIPAGLRDTRGRWFAVSRRARLVYLAKSVADAPAAMTYESLADPRWLGRICIGAGGDPDNIALLGALIAKDGAEKAAGWVEGVQANLARKPGGGGREGARDILAGICDLALGGSDDVGLMRSGALGEEAKRWGEAIRVVVPTFAKGGGTHFGVSGAALATHAPHPAEGRKLLEWLASDEAQRIFSRAGYGYPVKPAIAADPLVAVLGEIRADPLPLLDAAAERDTARRIVVRSGFDQ